MWRCVTYVSVNQECDPASTLGMRVKIPYLMTLCLSSPVVYPADGSNVRRWRLIILLGIEETTKADSILTTDSRSLSIEIYEF